MGDDGRMHVPKGSTLHSSQLCQIGSISSISPLTPAVEQPTYLLLKEVLHYESNPHVKDRDRDARCPGVQ